jgi:diguanylate cyclase (GGDEF)-like protein
MIRVLLASTALLAAAAAAQNRLGALAAASAALFAALWIARDEIGEGRAGRLLVLVAPALAIATFVPVAAGPLTAGTAAALLVSLRARSAERERLSRAWASAERIAAKEREIDRWVALEDRARAELTSEVTGNRALGEIIASGSPSDILDALSRSARMLGFEPGRIVFEREEFEIVARGATPEERDRFEPLLALARLAMLRHNRVAQFKAISRTDWLTGLPNRRALDEMEAMEARRAASLGLALSRLMIDVDHFKRFNDTHGHAVGDLVLSDVAGILREMARKSDFVARYGGEEFCLLLPETPIEAAGILAERIRAAVEAKRVRPPGHDLPLTVTVSIGVSDRDLRTADEALYAAKRAGRNRVVAERGGG